MLNALYKGSYAGQGGGHAGQGGGHAGQGGSYAGQGGALISVPRYSISYIVPGADPGGEG